MYNKNEFKQIGEISAGSLIAQFPGTNFIMKYDKGEGYVNDKQNIGYMSLSLCDIVAEKNGEPEGMLGMMGRNMLEELEKPAAKKDVKRIIKKHEFPIIYSKTVEGIEILTVPSLSGHSEIDEKNIKGMVLASYVVDETSAPIKRAYEQHMEAIGKKVLVSDKELLDKETLNLVDKTNKIYVKALDMTLEMINNMSKSSSRLGF